MEESKVIADDVINLSKDKDASPPSIEVLVVSEETASQETLHASKDVEVDINSLPKEGLQTSIEALVAFKESVTQKVMHAHLRKHGKINVAKRGASNVIYPSVDSYNALFLELVSRGYTDSVHPFIDMYDNHCLITATDSEKCMDAIRGFSSEYNLKLERYDNNYVLEINGLCKLKKSMVVVLRAIPVEE